MKKQICQAMLLSAAFVANAIATEEDLYFTELPIVASVSRLPQKLSEAPAAVTVIDRDMIRASGFRTVEDLMRLVPGFQVTSHNQDAALVAYHGLTGGMPTEEYTPRVQVLVDGRSQYSALFKAGVNWNLIPVVLENIERIEVIRGSNTVAYGSNAALGVINIITQDPSQTKGWMLAANRGVNFVRDETLRWGGKAGEADVRFTVHQLGDNGFQHGKYGDWYDSPDDRRSRVLDFIATLPLGNRDEMKFSLSEASDRSQFGRPDGSLKSPIWYANTSTTSLGVEWKRIVSSDEELKIRYNFTRDRSWGSYLSVQSFDTPLNGNVSGTTLFDSAGTSLVNELEFDHIFALSEQSRLMWGGSAKYVALSSMAQFFDSGWRHRSTYRVFGNVEHRSGREWTFNLGASLERDSVSGVNLDPRGAVNYHLTPENTLRFVASRAHRTPSLYENQGRTNRYGVSGGTVLTDIAYLGQGVEPERIDTLEVGYLGELKAVRASADVRVFREHIPNRIQIVPRPLPASLPDDHDLINNRNGIGQNILYLSGRADGALNMENVHINGYEYQLRWQPFEQTRLMYSNALVSIEADADVSQVAENIGATTDKITIQTRQSAPLRSQSAMLIQKLPYDVTASVMYFRASPMKWRRNSPELAQASERFDWRLAKSFQLGSSKAEVAYTVQMANESQEGRQTPLRLADKLHWLSLRLDF